MFSLYSRTEFGKNIVLYCLYNSSDGLVLELLVNFKHEYVQSRLLRDMGTHVCTCCAYLEKVVGRS